MYDINKKLKLGLSVFGSNVIFPICKILLVNIVGCYCIAQLLELGSGLLAFIIHSILLCLFSSMIIIVLGLDKIERKIIINRLKYMLRNDNKS